MLSGCLLLKSNKMTLRLGRSVIQLFQVAGYQQVCVPKWLSTLPKAAPRSKPEVKLVSILPGNSSSSTKIVFSDNRTLDFQYIWLRDNCHCGNCLHPGTQQKTLDTSTLDLNIRPKSVAIDASGHLCIEWLSSLSSHRSVYNPEWLHQYGLCFDNGNIQLEDNGTKHDSKRSDLELWDRVSIWKKLPEISWQEFTHSDEGLRMWLDMVRRYGLAFIRGVPTEKDQVIQVVNRFAYVKETSYGQTFDVVSVPDPSAHLAFTGLRLELHTDMNYRENSPGLQLLHCLKADNLEGGKSFFVDGFLAAKWLQENQPTSFHILSSIPVKFSISAKKMIYSQHMPIICTGKNGTVNEIHYNNRTMRSLQTPSHLVSAFYHAYKLFSDKLRDPASELCLSMVPGDLVAFNNRRVLHGRTGFDPTLVTRHLQGCYVDIDEAMARYDSLIA